MKDFKDPTPPKKAWKPTLEHPFPPPPEPDKPIPPPHPGNYCAAADGFMKAHQIQNVAQLREYIKRQLGSPVICVELSDDQLDDIIRDCVQYIQRYYMGEGHYSDYLIMELQPGISHYKLCQELESVVDFKTSNWIGGINDLFTVPHALLYDQVMGMNCWEGNCFGNSAAYGDILGSWKATLTWMAEANDMFGEHFQVRYNEKEKELEVQPSPKRPTKGMMKVWKRQRSERIFNDVIFKKMVVAKAGMVWTNALRKYNLQISGGGTLNADSLYASYKEDYDWCIERIELESPCGASFSVG